MYVDSSLSAAGSATINPQNTPMHIDNIVTVEVSGTYGTAVGAFQVSLDGTNWSNLAAVRMDTMVVETTPTLTDNTTRQWRMEVSPNQKWRFNLSSLGSGTIRVYASTAYQAGGLGFTLQQSGGALVLGSDFATGSNSTDRVTIKGIYMNPAVLAVAVPSITDPDCARVQVDVSSAFAVQPAVGDAVIAIPQEALPSACRLSGAWVYQTDGVEITFSSEGGNVTGANKNFKFLLIDLT